MVLTVGYVGSLGRKLDRAREGDPITQQGHDDCLNGTGAGAPIMLGGQTFTCLQLIGSQSLYFPGEKLQPGVVPGYADSGSVSERPALLPLDRGDAHQRHLPATTRCRFRWPRLLRTAFTSLLRIPTAMPWTTPRASKTPWQTDMARTMFLALRIGAMEIPSTMRVSGWWVFTITKFRYRRGSEGTPFLRSALVGWHFSGITTLQTGFPITIYDAGVYNSLYCDQFSFVNCPDVPNTSTFHIHTENPRNPGHYWFNTATFTQEPIGTFGNVKRNFFHGPGFNYSNFEVYKNIPLRGFENPRYIQVRLEAYNAFNHANFANPSGNFGAGPTVFGVIDSVDQPINAGGDPQPGRAIQLAGKFYF